MFALKKEFVAALEANENAFGVELSVMQRDCLADFYESVVIWNKRLHLVAPCPPSEFAIRHALEAVFLSEFLPADAGFVDIGTGAGIPAIPVLIYRADLRATLIESSTKKTIFLREAATRLRLQNRALIFNSRFEAMPPPEKGFVACRALDKFTEKLPEICAWSTESEKLLFFGGDKIRAELRRLQLSFSEQQIPMSEERFLFVVTPAKGSENDA